MHWYAIKVFFRREKQVFGILEEDGIEYYAQDILPSYIFIHCEETYARNLHFANWETLMVFKDAERKNPQAIPDKEFNLFRIITSSCKDSVTFLGEDLPKYHEGDKVRIKEGPLKGTEGIIKRIKKDRKLIVCLKGVAAVAISIMHPALLEKIEICKQTISSTSHPM